MLQCTWGQACRKWDMAHIMVSSFQTDGAVCYSFYPFLLKRKKKTLCCATYGLIIKVWNCLVVKYDFIFTMTGWNHMVAENSPSLYSLYWWIPERVGVKLWRQEEGGVTKEKLVSILPPWWDVSLPFSGGADEERTSPLINVKAAQQDAGAQRQQPLLSHT